MPYTEARHEKEGSTKRRRRDVVDLGESRERISVDRFLHGYAQSPSNYASWRSPEPNADNIDDNQTEPEYAQAAKVFLQHSPVCPDMWEAARELIPVGKT